MYAVDPQILQSLFTRTPVDISPQIIALSRELSPEHQPRFVSLVPEASAVPHECFFNVQSKVQRDGGEMVYGWAIWEWPRVFIEAEHHAVWSNGTDLIDVTPHEEGIHRVLFLADPVRVFDHNTYKRIINVKRPLNPAPVIQYWINAAHELQQYMEDSSDGPVMRMDRSRLLRLQGKVQYAHAGILAWLAQNTGRNEPCFCSSGLKFKRCCSRYIRPYN